MRKLLITLAIILTLQGCAAYTVTSGAVYLVTDKALPDHMSSTLAQADCNAVRVVTQGTYYCEQRDISKTYNRQWP
jgi:uncharacterized protein YceK